MILWNRCFECGAGAAVVLTLGVDFAWQRYGCVRSQ